MQPLLVIGGSQEREVGDISRWLATAAPLAADDERLEHLTRSILGARLRPLEGRPTLGGDEPGNWGAHFISWRQHEVIFNSAEDEDLFTNPATARLWTPATVLGNELSDPGRMQAQKRERGFWPVFEGKRIDGVKKKRPAFFAYLQHRLAAWAVEPEQAPSIRTHTRLNLTNHV